MALHLSSRKPRQLHYHHTGLKDDYMLLEVDDAILQDIKTSGCVHIAGGPLHWHRRWIAGLCSALATAANCFVSPAVSYSVIIKGAQNEEAVICSKSRTYALKYVETSNLLLLVPPDEVGTTGPKPACVIATL